jgi:two-component system chemotaxis sensor kinase CheA
MIMDGMEELKQTFFTECAELLADMEERLLKLEVGSTDTEQLNAVFRCTHSIKG